PTQLAVTASDPSLATDDLVRATIDVPAGVQAAIERRAHDAGLPALGLWAQVPHYLAAMPYPAASVALLEGLARVGGIEVDTTTLRTEADAIRTRIDALIAENEEHGQMVLQPYAAVYGSRHRAGQRAVMA